MPIRALAVIPARYASTRFPGKPLIKLLGKSMIQRAVESATACGVFERVVVATDDARIQEEVIARGGEAVLTDPNHPSGTDRVAEVARGFPEYDVIANVQGDLPYVSRQALSALLEPFLDPRLSMSTVACPLAVTEYTNPNSVKVVCSLTMRALYFSRAPIPSGFVGSELPVYHHLGLYAFAAEFLQQFTQLRPTPLEQCERLEQLRALEHGFSIQVGLTDQPLLEINAPADVPPVEEFLREHLGE